MHTITVDNFQFTGIKSSKEKDKLVDFLKGVPQENMRAVCLGWNNSCEPVGKFISTHTAMRRVKG